MGEMYVSVGKASKMLGVSTRTLYNWDKSGVLKAHHRTAGGNKLYSITQIEQFMQGNGKPCDADSD